jgi:hypothetical protein
MSWAVGLADKARSIALLDGGIFPERSNHQERPPEWRSPSVSAVTVVFSSGVGRASQAGSQGFILITSSLFAAGMNTGRFQHAMRSVQFSERNPYSTSRARTRRTTNRRLETSVRGGVVRLSI